MFCCLFEGPIYVLNRQVDHTQLVDNKAVFWAFPFYEAVVLKFKQDYVGSCCVYMSSVLFAKSSQA